MLFQLHFHESTYFWCVNFPIRFRLLWSLSMRHTVAVGWDLSFLHPRDQRKWVSKLARSYLIAKLLNVLTFNTYPLPCSSDQSEGSWFQGQKWVGTFILCAILVPNTCIWRTWLLLVIKTNFYFCDWISCCLEVLYWSNGLLLPVCFDSKQTPQRLFWPERLFWPQRSMWRKSEKDNLED